MLPFLAMAFKHATTVGGVNETIAPRKQPFYDDDVKQVKIHELASNEALLIPQTTDTRRNEKQSRLISNLQLTTTLLTMTTYNFLLLKEPPRSFHVV